MITLDVIRLGQTVQKYVGFAKIYYSAKTRKDGK